MELPSFAHMWQNPKFEDLVIRLLSPSSDVEATIHCPPAGLQLQLKCCPDVCQEVKVSKVVLCSESKYWSTRIERWDEQACSRKRVKVDEHKSLSVFEETIAMEDLPVMQAAILWAYTRQVPQGLTELIQGVHLADRWLMPGYMSACLDSLASLPADELTAADVNAMMPDDLPPVVLEHPGYQAVKANCARVLVRLFGKPQELLHSHLSAVPFFMFCNLTFAAVLWYAQQDDLELDSENSLAYLLTVWWSFNTERTESNWSDLLTQQRKQQLSSAVRVPYLSASYSHLVLPQLPWFTEVHAPFARAFLQVQRQTGVPLDAMKGVAIPEDWLKPPRVADDPDFTFNWSVTAAELQELHENARDGQVSLFSETFFWRGYDWCADITLDDQSSSLDLSIMKKTLNRMDVQPGVTLHALVALLNPRGSVLASSLLHGYHGEQSNLYDSEILEVPASREPRGASMPPARLMPDGQLRIELVMRGLDE